MPIVFFRPSLCRRRRRAKLHTTLRRPSRVQILIIQCDVIRGGGAKDDAALIDHDQESPSVSEAGSTSGSAGNNASLASGEPAVRAMPMPMSMIMRSGSPPASTAAATADEEDDVSKLDLAIMGCTITLLMTMAVNIGGLGWETAWKVLYGGLMIVSFVSTITGFLTAVVGRARTRTRRSRLSPSCARLGLLVAAALFVVFLSCRLARFGCLGGVAAAAAVVVLLAVAWVLSEPPPPVEEEAVSVSLPPDAP